MKIRPKIEKMNLPSYGRFFILDQEETIPSQFQDVFHDIWLKIIFQNPWRKNLSYGVRWKKKLEVFVFWKWCEKFKFYYFEKFSHFTNFDEMKILGNSNKILSTLENLKQTLTLSLSSCSPNLKCANEAYGVKN